MQRQCTPAGVLYAASLWLSNSAYLYLSVSFIQMTKSLMPGLVYATGIFMGTEHFSKANAANMVLIAFGVVVCAIGEVNLVFKGVGQQLAALLFEVCCFVLSCQQHREFINCSASSGVVCAWQHRWTPLKGPLRSACFILITWPFQDRDVQAARLSLVQVLINSKGLQMNPLQSLYYVSPACLICLSAPFGEHGPDIDSLSPCPS